MLGTNGLVVPTVCRTEFGSRNMWTARQKRDAARARQHKMSTWKCGKLEPLLVTSESFARTASSKSMPHPLSRDRSFPATAALFVIMSLVTQACAGSADGVTISGDVAGLDTIGLRGGAMIAEAGQTPLTIDSLRAVATGKVSRPHNASAAGASVDASALGRLGVNPMTIRAQARGDSMARAAARKLASGTAPGRSRADTVRGVIALIGSAPAKQLVLTTDNGSRTIALSGMATTGMSRFVGLELMIRGVMVSPRDVVVSDYLVRAVDGVPAYDGTLSGGAQGSVLLLTDGSGRKNIGVPPSSLKGREGTRVWIAMKPGTRTATSYGVIGRR